MYWIVIATTVYKPHGFNPFFLDSVCILYYFIPIALCAAVCICRRDYVTRWRHQMETLSALLPFVRGIHRWIPLTKASDVELWCFLWSTPEQRVEQTVETPVTGDAIALIMWWLGSPRRQWRILTIGVEFGTSLTNSCWTHTPNFVKISVILTWKTITKTRSRVRKYQVPLYL